MSFPFKSIRRILRFRDNRVFRRVRDRLTAPKSGDGAAISRPPDWPDFSVGVFSLNRKLPLIYTGAGDPPVTLLPSATNSIGCTASIAQGSRRGRREVGFPGRANLARKLEGELGFGDPSYRYEIGSLVPYQALSPTEEITNPY